MQELLAACRKIFSSCHDVPTSQLSSIVISTVAAIVSLSGCSLCLSSSSASQIPDEQCALFDGNSVARVIVPCRIFYLNNKLTMVWQVAGRGIGSRVVAEDQWDEYSQAILTRCDSKRKCLQANGRTLVVATECQITEPVQPPELDQEIYKPISESCI